MDRQTDIQQYDGTFEESKLGSRAGDTQSSEEMKTHVAEIEVTSYFFRRVE